MVNTTGNKWRIIIVENEPNIRFLIKNLIHRRYPDFEVVADVDNTIEALRLIEDDPHIHGVFLDIHFDCQVESKGVSAGFDLAYALTNMNNPPWVVFMTARAQEYALEAHKKKYDQIGFLNKPFNITEIDEQISWIRQHKPIPKKSILISHRVQNIYGESKKVEAEKYLDEILYIHTNKEENTVRVHLFSGEILDKNNNTLSWWATELEHYGFFKIGKSCIVNLHHVLQINEVEPFFIILHPKNEKLPVAADYAKKLKIALQNKASERFN